MTFFRWSRVKDTNNTADSTCPFPEGQSPSSLNDGSRGQMAALAKFRDDISGAILTGGTSAAYTVTSYQGFDSLANLHNQMIGFTPHTSNVDTVLLNVDGLGLLPLRSAPGVELVRGTLVLGTPYVAVYSNVDGVFYLRGYYSSPYNVPFLGGMDYWDTVAPNSSFIFPIGQALSRTVYSATFTRWGTRFGAGDGSTTFNAPDKRERVSVMMTAAASRLTASYFGGDPTQLGAVGGGESDTLVTANFPPYTPAGGVTTTTSINLLQSSAIAGTGSSFYGTAGGTAPSISGVSTFAGTPQGGTSTPIRTVQPTIVCNYIMRII